jgi:hypothetical protein
MKDENGELRELKEGARSQVRDAVLCGDNGDNE